MSNNVRKEKNVCVVVFAALSWWGVPCTSSVQQQQQQHKQIFFFPYFMFDAWDSLWFWGEKWSLTGSYGSCNGEVRTNKLKSLKVARSKNKDGGILII